MSCVISFETLSCVGLCELGVIIRNQMNIEDDSEANSFHVDKINQ